MAYTWIQEIVIIMSDSARFSGHVMKTDGKSDFESETILTDNKRCMAKIGNITNHVSANDAFEEFVKIVENYIKKESCSVVSIDSPCNAPYIDSAQQQGVLTKHGINIKPTVNGK